MSDPENFENPEAFEPKRYICSSSGVYKPHPLLLPFGIGKRECPGKSLAKMELFLFFATLLHQYSFLPSKEGAPNLNSVTYPLTRSPKPFKVRVVQRSSTPWCSTNGILWINFTIKRGWDKQNDFEYYNVHFCIMYLCSVCQCIYFTFQQNDRPLIWFLSFVIISRINRVELNHREELV